MIRKAFKMKLLNGMAAEYEKRHNELWDEMKEMIHEYGGQIEWRLGRKDDN